MTRACVYCGDQLDPTSPTVWRRVVGWERKAAGMARRGGSDIAAREQRDEFACDACVRRVKSGVAVTQEALI